MKTSPPISHRWSTFGHLALWVCVLPLLALDLSARTRDNNEQAQADQALLERRAELIPMLSSTERLRMSQFEARIEEGQRVLRSSEALMQTQPTALNPNRDIAADRRQAQELRQRGEAMMREGREGVLSILRNLQQRIDDDLYVSPDAMRYRLAIPAVRIENTLPDAIAEVMERTRQAGYERIFFDSVFSWEEDAFTADEALTRMLYDLLLAEDGNRLVVGRAFEPVLQRAEDVDSDARPELHFDNRSPLPSSLIAAEVFRVEDGSAFLSFRTIDLDTWQLIAATIVKLESRATTSAQLFDAEGMIRRFEGLREPYLFAVLSVFNGNSDSEDFLKMRLLQTLIAKHTSLPFGESVFMRTYYLPESAHGEMEWPDSETAFFITQHSEDAVQVQARPRDSEHLLLIGTLKFPIKE